MKNKVKVIIYIFLAITIGIISSYILNTYIIPNFDGDTLETLAQIFYSDKVEEIGLTETIQKKYINISNILAIVLIIISGVSEPDDVAGAVVWSGVHTCWHALKLYIWGIKMGRSVGDVDTVKLAMDIIDFHPIRLVLIYLIFGCIVGEIIEHIGDVLCSDSTNSSTQSQTTNDDLEKISLDKKN